MASSDSGIWTVFLLVSGEKRPMEGGIEREAVVDVRETSVLSKFFSVLLTGRGRLCFVPSH